MMEKVLEAQELLAMSPLPDNAEALLQKIYDSAPDDEKQFIEHMFEALDVERMGAA